MKILINTVSTKRHAGGGFQIAYNFVLETLKHQDVEWYYITSKDLDDVIGHNFSIIRSKRYFVFPTQPDFKKSYRWVKKEIKLLEHNICPDVVYSITAPSYFSFETTEVMRFTNPWLTHPNKYSWSVLSLKNKLRYYLYALNQKRLIKKVHYFVTQTETCKKGIVKITGESESHVKVVHNVLPAIFKSVDTNHIVKDDWINIACVGNSTPHKNFDIIPFVAKELRAKGINKFRFHTTIPEESFLFTQISSIFNKLELDKHWMNHGRISQKELAIMYKSCQLCFLPTLLEVFSASTIEAMYFELPIVASDFDFNSEVLGDSCLYFKPKDAKEAANKLAVLIGDNFLQENFKSKMKQKLKFYEDYGAHFMSIKEFLLEVARNSKKEN